MPPDIVVLSPALPDEVRTLIRNHPDPRPSRTVYTGVILTGLTAAVATGWIVWWLLHSTGFTTPPSDTLAAPWLIAALDALTAGLAVVLTGVTAAVAALDTTRATARAWQRREHRREEHARWQALHAWSDDVVWLGQLDPARRARMNQLLDQARQLWRTSDATFDHAALWIRVWDAAQSSAVATRLDTALARQNENRPVEPARKAHADQKIAALDTRVGEHTTFLSDQQRLHDRATVYPIPVEPHFLVELADATADADALLPLSLTPP